LWTAASASRVVVPAQVAIASRARLAGLPSGGAALRLNLPL
jgi:hypothetical protein